MVSEKCFSGLRARSSSRHLRSSFFFRFFFFFLPPPLDHKRPGEGLQPPPLYPTGLQAEQVLGAPLFVVSLWLCPGSLVVRA